MSTQRTKRTVGAGFEDQRGRKTVEIPVKAEDEILGHLKNEEIEPCRFCEDHEG